VVVCLVFFPCLLHVKGAYDGGFCARLFGGVLSSAVFEVFSVWLEVQCLEGQVDGLRHSQFYQVILRVERCLILL
jgi:hypothetical protein